MYSYNLLVLVYFCLRYHDIFCAEFNGGGAIFGRIPKTSHWFLFPRSKSTIFNITFARSMWHECIHIVMKRQENNYFWLLLVTVKWSSEDKIL